ncbi:hypothetical protein [Hymenobacter sp. DG25A]|uniref:hypothetical protein n=1 Tax=Hymenobacter sp. DG25A TaxID=1385663 RepID=UPI0012F82EB2|nr:hypothetical protein [Hymenobacter sp. DG25A]
MKLIGATALCLVLVIGNVLLGYYCAPLEILLTPLVVIGTMWLLLAAGPYASPWLTSLLSAVLICGHDAGVKLYGGGTHDSAGQGFIHAFLFFGLIPAYLLLLARLDQRPNLPASARLVANLLFPLLVGGYLSMFGWLGVEM